jgi:hypothetical protein
MALTENETMAVAYAAALHEVGCGFAPEPWLLPECEAMRDRGWFERRMVDHEACYFLTPEGASALTASAVATDAKQRSN